MAGVTATLDDRREVHACWDSKLAARMAAIADRAAPDWRKGAPAPAGLATNACTFTDDPIRGELVHPN
jgi:hypothetical protein